MHHLPLPHGRWLLQAEQAVPPPPPPHLSEALCPQTSLSQRMQVLRRFVATIPDEDRSQRMQVLHRFVASIPDEQRCDAELLPALHDLAAILFGTELRRAELLRNVWQVLPECRPLVWRVARQLLESACTALQPTPRLRLQNLNLDPNDTVDTRGAREVGDRRRLPFGMGYRLRPRLAITEGSAQPPDRRQRRVATARVDRMELAASSRERRPIRNLERLQVGAVDARRS
jgi:hypothetical protein